MRRLSERCGLARPHRPAHPRLLADEIAIGIEREAIERECCGCRRKRGTGSGRATWRATGSSADPSSISNAPPTASSTPSREGFPPLFIRSILLPSRLFCFVSYWIRDSFYFLLMSILFFQAGEERDKLTEISRRIQLAKVIVPISSSL